MNREEARQYIIDRSTDYLQQDRSKKGYICPICGSGSGNKGTEGEAERAERGSATGRAKGRRPAELDITGMIS